MDLIHYVRDITVAGTVVNIHANADTERYEFRIDGAVCAEQSYDGIRCSQDDPDFADYLDGVFVERGRRAVAAHNMQHGPIYV